MVATATPELLRIRKENEERLNRKKPKETVRKKLFHKQTPDKKSRHRPTENADRIEALQRKHLSSKTDKRKQAKGQSVGLKTKTRKSKTGGPTGWKLPRRKETQKKQGRPMTPSRKPIWLQQRSGKAFDITVNR